MAYVRFSPGLSSLRVVLATALVAGCLPAAEASAQTGPRVRVAVEETDILTFQGTEDDVLMTAQRGATFEVIHTQGDKYEHREHNWYWVLLPRDAWGTQRAGWISGRYVEQLPPEPRKELPPAQPQFSMVERNRPPMPTPTAADASASIVTTPAEEPLVRELIVNFAFDKSDLTAEARGKLSGAVAMLKDAQSVTIALEGHADGIGTEPYNDKLGLARAEAVRRYLSEQSQVPADKISVVSHGETQPMAPNETAEGRAQNRRVVVRITM